MTSTQEATTYKNPQLARISELKTDKNKEVKGKQ